MSCLFLLLPLLLYIFAMISRYLVDVIEKAETMSGVIIIITNEPVWSNIQRLGISLKLSYPNETELKETIENEDVEKMNKVITMFKKR